MSQVSRGYFYYGLNFVLVFLSYFIPKSNNQVLIGSTLFIGNPKYFYMYLCKNKKPDCSPLWITRDKKLLTKLKNEGFPVVDLNSCKGFFAILRSKYLVFSHDVRQVSYFMWLPGRFKKIELWHAIATKGLGVPPYNRNANWRIRFVQRMLIRDRKSYHTIVTCSDKTKKRDVGVFQNENVRILGYPRNDVFFDNSRVFEDLYDRFNLKKYAKVILYSPTWRENAHAKIFGTKIPFREDFLSELNEFFKNKNFIMLVKKHNSETGKRLDIPNFSNILNIPKDLDIQELLIHVDVIITDYSSVMKDFCLSGRPMIFYLFDYDEYTKNNSLFTDYFTEIPGPIVMKEDELLNYLQNLDIFTSNKEYKEKYEKLIVENHFFRDGKSSERLYNHLFNEQ